MSKLLACRGCLATDVKLYDLFENKLWEDFGRFVGVPVLSGDGYPHHLCSTCTALLQKFVAYRCLCRKAQDLLEEAELRGIPITTSYIRKIDRKKHMLNNNVKKELFDNITINIKENVEDAVESKNSYDRVPDLKLDDNEQYCVVAKKENAIDNNSNNDDTEFITVDNRQIPETKFINVNDADHKYAPEDITLSNVKIENREKRKTTIDLTSDDDLKKNNKIKKTKKKTVKRTIVKKPKDVKLNGMKSKKRSTVDITKEFAEQYNFTLTLLTREEQIEEIRVLKETPTSKIQCDDCGMGFNYKNKFFNHYRSKHDPSLGDYVCTICNTRFREKPYLHCHYKTVHSFKFVCKLCNFTTRARPTAAGHAAYHAGKKFTCECGKSFGHSTSYLSHKRLTHTSSLVGCEYCGEAFISEWGLRAHKRRIHGDILETSMFECAKCKAKFRTGDALAKHESLSCEGYNCVNCGETFVAGNLLTYHLVQSHNHRNSSIEYSECATCNAKFHNQAALWRHTADKCGAVVPCLQCGVGFPTDEMMNDHLKTHSTDVFKCEVCKKSFVSAFNFAEHYAKHAVRREHVKVTKRAKNPALRGLQSGGKPTKIAKRIMCEVCGFLCLESAYPTHLKIHTDEKDFTCSVCNKRFRVLIALQVHLGVKPHQCHLCQKYFQTPSCVKMHIKTVHMKLPMPPRTRKRRPKCTE
ncbi:zinc finger protein 676-like isoform X2 [Galleria mellonella]|uniref:Zinc finger protein 676-like isoform X2 n=1 Tax=Galleria mellonella TaxID=7137 RepID=A0ABM3MAP1_GALME|nr:zinc finger protein 676-like isoform X2 [Galleria mellonella]